MHRLHQAAVDASKLVAGDATRRSLKLWMIAGRSCLLVERRPLPAFLIIGAMRAGTSSLFKYLGSHPDTAASLRKEVRFFTRYWHQGVNWYRAHFPITGTRVAFEATPDYLFHPFAAARAAQTVPNAKVIVLLREPIARARSHYDHMVRLGFERRSLTKALEQESCLMQDALARFEEDEYCWQPLFMRHSYLARGCYARQLEKWLSVFPVENLMILWSEDLFVRPSGVLDDLASFLAISPGKFSGIERNYSISARVREEPRRGNEKEALVPAWAVDQIAEENTRLLDLLRTRLPTLKLPEWLTESGGSRSMVSECCRPSV